MPEIGGALKDASKLTVGELALARIPTPLTGKDADTLDGHEAIYFIPQLTEALFRANTAVRGDVGSWQHPETLNDNDTGSMSYAAAVNDEVDVVIDRLSYVTQYRHYGHTSNTNLNGRFSLQAFMGGHWLDIKTGIIPRQTGNWGSWTALTIPAYTAGIRLKCTTYDGGSRIFMELEMKA